MRTGLQTPFAIVEERINGQLPCSESHLPLVLKDAALVGLAGKQLVVRACEDLPVESVHIWSSSSQSRKFIA